jgi:hypothetical protein
MRQPVTFSELPADAIFWREYDSSFWWKKLECLGVRAGDVYCNVEHNYIKQHFPPDSTVWVERNDGALAD